MSCANGMCGVPSSALGRAPCCDDCAENEYRARMRAAFNPWQRNAGSNPAFNPYDSSSFGGSSLLASLDEGGDGKAVTGGSGAAGTAAALGSQAIGEIGATARAWLDADLERDRIRASRDVAAARADADAARAATQSSQSNVESSGGNSTLMLVGLGVGVALLSGMFGGRRR